MYVDDLNRKLQLFPFTITMKSEFAPQPMRYQLLSVERLTTRHLILNVRDTAVPAGHEPKHFIQTRPGSFEWVELRIRPGAVPFENEKFSVLHYIKSGFIAEHVE